MERQAIIIGLGQFGMSVARALTQQGVAVFAVDADEERVELAAEFAAEAACLDATDVDLLQRTGPERRDVCVCSIGDSSKEASIICTALLRQLGAPRIIARANDALHARILTLVGAHQVVNPEQEFGERFASQLLHESIVGEMRLGPGVFISEVRTPAPFVGSGLAELQLPKRYGVTVVAIRQELDGQVTLPDAKTRLANGDVLVVVSAGGAVSRMLEGNPSR
jgi:trk system potassium uptake protein TrkA